MRVGAARLADMSRRAGADPFPVGPSSMEEIWARRPADSLAVVDGDVEVTTAQLYAEVERVARCLVGTGLRPGGRVLWVLGNEPAALVGLLATIRAGGVWVGLDRRSTEAERDKVVHDATPSLVLTSLPDGDPSLELPPAPDRGEPGAIAYTSGTTGAPKGVVHTTQQLLYPAAAAIATEALDHSSRIGTPLSLATLNILLLGPLTALACGGTAVMMRRTDPAGFADDVRRHRVTRALVVPTIVRDLAATRTDPAALASLERVIMGGSGFDRDAMRDAQATLEVPLVASYGLSEAPTGVARMNVGDDGARPLPGIDIAIEPDGEITLAPSSAGPWANTWHGAIGYWGLGPDSLWHDGKIHTGDHGSIDDAGRLHVVGRISDMINRGGATIAPSEIERVLLGLEGVDDAAVFALDDPRLGQRVAAAIVGTVEPAEIAGKARAVLSSYKVPETWYVVDAIPRNANGKVDRRRLQRLDG